MNIITLVLLSVLLIAAGCNRVINTDQDIREQFSHSNQGMSESGDMFAQFIAYMWSGKDYNYYFFADGTFKWDVVSDYSDQRTGKWEYSKLSKGDGLLFLLWNNKNGSVGFTPVKRTDVLYFRFTSGNKLRLAGDEVKLVKLSPDGSAPKQPEALFAIVNKENFTDYFLLTAHPWQKIGTKNNQFIPDSYLFRQDGTFTAGYRKGECQHGGNWSVKEAQVILEIPPEHCDSRGYNKAVTWGQSYKLENTSLILDQEYQYAAQ